jgi:hypothetical protein
VVSRCNRIALTVVLLVVVSTGSAFAHPGRTDSSGGHTCRTNCDDWGLYYGEYHSHGGYAAPPVIEVPEEQPQEDAYVAPTEEPVSAVVEATSTPDPIVAGETASDDSSSGLLALGALGGLGYVGWKKIRGKKSPPPPEAG